VLRQQINVLRRAAPRRQSFGIFDRLIFVGLYRVFPKACGALAIVKPDTIIRWHGAGFKAYWRWKSRRCGGRPTVPLEVRKLIRDMSIANPPWGAPRIHGELLMLGVEIGQTSVAKYMVKRREPPSQGWKTFLRNHADGIAAIDLFVVPTISFRLLYGLLIVGLGRRQCASSGAACTTAAARAAAIIVCVPHRFGGSPPFAHLAVTPVRHVDVQGAVLVPPLVQAMVDQLQTLFERSPAAGIRHFSCCRRVGAVEFDG
jgi:hypothetical protein